MAYQDFLIDKRIVQRNLDKGLVDAKTYEKALSQLPDRADNAATATLDEADDQDLDIEDEGDDEDDDEEEEG